MGFAQLLGLQVPRCDVVVSTKLFKGGDSASRRGRRRRSLPLILVSPIILYSAILDTSRSRSNCKKLVSYGHINSSSERAGRDDTHI
jgi:hypothetical protein